VHELIAAGARALRLAPIAGDAVTDSVDAPDLLDVDVDELARPRALVAVLGLIGVSDHPCSSTRETIRSRCLDDRAALAWSFIRCPPWDWGL